MFDVSLGAVTLKSTAPKLYPNLRTAAPPWPNKKAISRLHPVVIPEVVEESGCGHGTGEVDDPAEEPLVCDPAKRLSELPLHELQ